MQTSLGVTQTSGTRMELITMGGAAEAAASRRRVFEVDQDAAIAELEQTWAPGGYHAFSVDHGTWSAISSAGDVLTGATPDELERAVRTHWQALQ